MDTSTSGTIDYDLMFGNSSMPFRSVFRKLASVMRSTEPKDIPEQDEEGPPRTPDQSNHNLIDPYKSGSSSGSGDSSQNKPEAAVQSLANELVESVLDFMKELAIIEWSSSFQVKLATL